MNVAILGAGGIAQKMATTICAMKEDDVCLYAIGSRSKEKAEDYAKTYGFVKAYGSYEEVLSDDKVDLCYIALPHSHHHRYTLKALRAGKHVLCEKAFAMNSSQALEMISLAEEKGLLLAEAIWTRYMPSRYIIQDIVESGVLGKIHTLTANLGYPVSHKECMIRPELAGGCLLDLTIYPLNFASMVLGNDIALIHSHCIKTNTGVDGQDTVMLTYADGKMATLFSTMYTMTNRNGYIYGTD
ncbi:MAG: Gfo/Idh/MocA family oxidoreductase, partial [Blautia sp.]|nr:Gfo/Idh/MocA family oxidoreductase [Blautia sp.]